MKEKTAGRLTAAALCIIIFVILLIAVMTGSAYSFDNPVREFIYRLRSDTLTAIMKIITYMGNWQTVTLLCIVLLAIKKTRCTYGIPVAAGAIFVTVLNKVIKSIVARTRPDVSLHLIEQGGMSFPSGHAITSMFVYGMLIYLLYASLKNMQRKQVNEKSSSHPCRVNQQDCFLEQKNSHSYVVRIILMVILAIPMIFVGVSRVYLGVHYPTDVLAGWCLAGVVIVVESMIYGMKSARCLS